MIDPSFAEEIKKKTSLLKVVLNTEVAKDLLYYLNEETERHKKEILEINKKLNEVMKSGTLETLTQRFDEYQKHTDLKLEDTISKLENVRHLLCEHEIHSKSLFNKVDAKVDLISKKLGLNSNSPFLDVSKYGEDICALRAELTAFKRNTAKLVGINEDQLVSSRLNPDELDLENGILSSRSIKSSRRNNSNHENESDEENVMLKDVLSQLNTIKSEIEEQKKEIKNIEANENIFTEERIIKAKEQMSEIEMQKKVLDEREEQLEKEINSSNKKDDNFTALQNEIDKMKRLLDQQTHQLSDIQEITNRNHEEINEYMNETLHASMKCDEEDEKFSKQIHDLQSLFLNSLQDVKELMDSMSEQISDCATKSEVMNAFTEVFTPKQPHGTSVGVSKCKCLACGRARPTVNPITDSNLAEILNYRQLSRESFNPCSKVMLVSGERLKTSGSKRKSSELVTPRRSKTNVV
ncbi:hypothetical protein TRFO_41114 [Tritrichomonas foetus]|uniref:Uncharacterized protein n=1 Tax=Tritrichomonas foetus TaxID=1144522 RepID=A0A1J4L5X2_9EUKA|nr:hypothetical protein TRFO_41114 [Tritrichomonas foetus]|eukprot:OHT17350.1 hypothetical protein TRFO_41114 [Tritrichomonas foetus]